MDNQPRARPFFAVKKIWLIRRLLSIVVVLSFASPAAAQLQARVTNLNNIAFGTLGVSVDQKKADNVCVYVNSSAKTYTVTATGSGSAGAFAIQNGSIDLPYSLQWADASGQTSGVALSSGVTSQIFSTTATASGCTSGPTTTASDVFILAVANVAAVPAGTYTGTLYVTITPQ